MERFRADWHAANGEEADMAAEVDVPSVNKLDMEELVLLLEKDVRWTK